MFVGLDFDQHFGEAEVEVLQMIAFIADLSSSDTEAGQDAVDFGQHRRKESGIVQIILRVDNGDLTRRPPRADPLAGFVIRVGHLTAGSC